MPDQSLDLPMPFQTYRVSTVFCCQCPASHYLLQESPSQSLEEFSDHGLEVFILFLRQWFQLKLTRLLKPFSFFFGGWKVALSSMPFEHITYCNFFAEKLPLKRNLLICVVISNTQKVLTDYVVLICLPCSCTPPACSGMTTGDFYLLCRLFELPECYTSPE